MTVSMWWVLWAFLAGAYGGFFLFAMLGIGRNDDDSRRSPRQTTREAKHAQRHAFAQPGGPSTVI